jgi:thioredoxin 1
MRKGVIIAGVIIAAAAIVIARNAGRKEVAGDSRTVHANRALVAADGTNATAPETATSGQTLPRLVDLGAGKCVPCKMMAPILEDLKQTYAGRLEVAFIDVWETPDAATKYGINVIPTQIFYAADGRELFRHEGFYGKEDILAKWQEFGVDLGRSDNR